MGSVRNVFLDRYETLRNRLIVTSATTFSLNEAFLRIIALHHLGNLSSLIPRKKQSSQTRHYDDNRCRKLSRIYHFRDEPQRMR